MVLLPVLDIRTVFVWRRKAVLTVRKTYIESDGEHDIEDNILT
jgi:hypothetical protein